MRIGPAALLVLAALLAASCGASGKKAGTAAPAEAPPLVIYSPHPTEIAEYITREFRQKTGIPVELVQAGTGELMERMKSGQEPAPDLFWGGGVESLETVSDLFAPYVSAAEEHILPDYRSERHLWNPFSVLPTVIIYNESLIPEEKVPESWEDLLDPWFKDRLIMADPEKSGSSFTILATVLNIMGKRGAGTFGGWDYVERLAAQLGSQGLAPSSSLVYTAVASGDFFAGITFENYALALKKIGTNVGCRFPREGTSAVPDGIALVKGARRETEAKRFIDFVLGKDVQTLLGARWERRSVRDDAGAAIPPAGERFIAYPVAEAAAKREAILSRWREAYARSSPGTPGESSR